MAVSCPYIVKANIAIDGLGFTLYGVTWQYTPLGEQAILVQYRVQGDITWINVSTSLKVDAGGNISVGSLNILNSAVQGETYEIRFVNQCGSLEYIQTFTFSTSIYSDYYLVDNAIYNICGNDPLVLYSKVPFGNGVEMFSDIGMTTPITGYSFISSTSEDTIYNINSGTGIVGAVTSYGCRNSISLKGKLSNVLGSVCGSSITNIYSEESPKIGIFVFTDEALSEPVLGFDYVVFVGNETIFGLDNSTGEIIAESGTCTAFGNSYLYSIVKQDLPNATETQLFTVGGFGKGAVMFTDYAMTTPLTGYNYISLNGSIRDISSTTGLVGCLSTNC